MTAALVLGLQPQLEDLVGEADRDDAAAHREDVGVVVLARQPRGVEVVAQRRTNPVDLVRGDLLALPAAAEHDAAIGAPVDHGAAYREADRRVVDRLLVRRAEVLDRVPETRERAL